MHGITATVDMIVQRWQLLFWVARHGGDIKKINFFPVIYFEFWDFIPDKYKQLKLRNLRKIWKYFTLEIYYCDIVDYAIRPYYERLDWQGLKAKDNYDFRGFKPENTIVRFYKPSFNDIF